VIGDIFDLRKFSVHDGPGIRTTVFFGGCPLSCWWCHNPEGIGRPGDLRSAAIVRRSSRPVIDENDRFVGPGVKAEAVAREVSKDRVFYDKTGGGVTLSGGEPMMQPDFLRELIHICKGSGIHTALDTSGYAPRVEYDKLEGTVDLFLFDIKLIDDRDHRRFTGVSNRVIHENLGRLCDRGERIWIRIPLIPGITDGDREIDSIVAFLRDYDKVNRVCLLPYNRMGEDKFRRMGLQYRPGRLKTQSNSTVERIRDRFINAGFDVSVGG